MTPPGPRVHCCSQHAMSSLPRNVDHRCHAMQSGGTQALFSEQHLRQSRQRTSPPTNPLTWSPTITLAGVVKSPQTGPPYNSEVYFQLYSKRKSKLLSSPCVIYCRNHFVALPTQSATLLPCLTPYHNATPARHTHILMILDVAAAGRQNSTRACDLPPCRENC